MTSYLFLFGRTPELAFTELLALLPQSIRITPNVGYVEDEKETFDPSRFIHRLGGTVKIARIFDVLIKFNPTDIVRLLLASPGENEIVFGVSSYSSDIRITSSFLRQVKVELYSHGIKARYINSDEGRTLSSVVVEKQHVHFQHCPDSILFRDALDSPVAWHRRESNIRGTGEFRRWSGQVNI